MKFAQYQFLCQRMFAQDENGTIKQHYDEIKPQQLSPLALAYIGDAYFHLFVRTTLLYYEQNKVRVLNDFGAKIVSATYQAYAYKELQNEYTAEEQKIFRRAYNAKSHAPRVASVIDYHLSTGFEAVLGYLQLSGQQVRLEEICQKSFEVIIKDISNKQNKN